MEERSILKWREYDSVVCPKCKSSDIAKIMYGRPIWTDDFKEKLDSGEITLGSCFINKDNPVYECNQCRERWGRLYDDCEESKQLFDHMDSARVKQD